MRGRHLFAIEAFIAALALASTTAACDLFPSYKTVPPERLAEMGTYRVPEATREAATEACATALATLGYTVTVKDPRAGVVKTAPRTMSTVTTGSTTAGTVVEDSLAWNLSIEQAGSDAVIHATPRGYRNGSEMHGDIWVASIIDVKFKDLWGEVDATLNVKPAK